MDPRDVVFRAPWEARAFAIALALCQDGKYQWEEFRRRLMSEVSAAPSDEYYRQFLRALEELLRDKGIVDQAELIRRMGELAAQRAVTANTAAR
jgi:nitrile hydratase accessory protein